MTQKTYENIKEIAQNRNRNPRKKETQTKEEACQTQTARKQSQAHSKAQTQALMDKVAHLETQLMETQALLKAHREEILATQEAYNKQETQVQTLQTKLHKEAQAQAQTQLEAQTQHKELQRQIAQAQAEMRVQIVQLRTKLEEEMEQHTLALQTQGQTLTHQIMFLRDKVQSPKIPTLWAVLKATFKIK